MAVAVLYSANNKYMHINLPYELDILLACPITLFGKKINILVFQSFLLHQAQ